MSYLADLKLLPRYRSFLLLLWMGIVSTGQAAPLETFRIKDHLNHRWVDELVHFDFSITTGAKDLVLIGPTGAPVPCQFTDVVRDAALGRVTGKVWTVITLEPKAEAVFRLQPGQPTATTRLNIRHEGDALVLSNDRIAVGVPEWPGALSEPVDLVRLQAPILWVSRAGGTRLGAGEWVNTGAPLRVREATTTILEQGPVRLTVRQNIVFVDGQTYRFTIQLAARQEAAIITEASTVDAPQAGLRLSMEGNLGADHVLWNNQWKKTEKAGTWEKVITPVRFDRNEVIFRLRPWSFWWLDNISEWAGFYREGSDDLVGVLTLHPSHWSPAGWSGFDRTEIPVTSGPGSRLDLFFGLDAMRSRTAKGTEVDPTLHREWAITAGSVSEHTAAGGPAKLRREMIKYGEFPLDQVKDYNFDFTPARVAQKHPFLLFNSEDVARVRQQAQTVPSIKEQVDAARKYIAGSGGVDRTLKSQGWEAFYTKHYIGNYLIEKLPEAYLGSDDPLYGQLMAAAVKGMAKDVRDTFLEDPKRPAIGAYGPWFSENISRLLLNYDLIAGSGLLSPEDEAEIRDTLVFSAYFLANPDYWNTARGLASANPNMTSSIQLPQGLLALFLDGHPDAKQWLKNSEDELRDELNTWVAPGGAWIEDPGYQAASLDGIFLLAQAIKNVQGRDYFADPQFKATMDYYGFLLTPPDRRFNSPKADIPAAPMTLPSIGDMFSGFITCFNGWMAASTARTDPAYSARQQFYWKMQNYYLGSAGRAKGFILALVNPGLPDRQPAEPSRPFPRFGSIVRTSWTDPAASYLAHRTGNYVHHYHDDFNSFVYYAKGSPLCLDFGNDYVPVRRAESWYHNRVSFDIGSSPKHYNSTGDLADFRSLRRTIDYSYGKSSGSGNQQDHRHILLVKSSDPNGANYVVIRDSTDDGQPNQQFYWNLWCLSGAPEVSGNLIHFPGQLGVDLDVHLLAPANPIITNDHWAWKQQIYVWGNFAEEQYGVHIAKQGSSEDYFTVLYPRAADQSPAQVTGLAGGAGAQIETMEGTDYVLLSPNRGSNIENGDVTLTGEIAFARRYRNGGLRLAVVKGENCAARIGEWGLSSNVQTALEVNGAGEATGETDGNAHEARILLPTGFGSASVSLDGRPIEARREGHEIVVALPGGYHTFTINR